MLKIDEKKLMRLLEDFHKLAGIKICFFDEEGRELACVPKNFCSFCGYIRSSKLGDAACVRSDAEAFEVCRKTGKLHRYTCHMGLTECVTPILRDGECLGFIMIGQAAGNPIAPEYAEEKARLYGLDGKRAAELYSDIEFQDEERINASVSIMEACASYLYLNRLMLEEKSMAVKLRDHIKKHLDGDLSVNALCREFKLSRVDLYACFAHSFDSTPAEYVKSIRLEEACSLLESTDMRITEIAGKVGIADYNYFSKIFRRAYGMSPREYRAIPR
ncbi:MAG: PocR ligand-binding domain-containing protein [Clostridia bacterium]|nr:PocR ligand-binding domain-containing protein [Clostridia bacterium]